MAMASEIHRPQTAEPDYIAFTADEVNWNRPLDWIEARSNEAKGEGMTGSRVTYSAERQEILFEAWKVLPTDQGQPRWHGFRVAQEEEQSDG